jgi:glutaredoxin
MKIIRWVLGRFILLLDFIFTPRGVKRPQEQQAQLDQQTIGLSLYQYAACPFCVKVRRSMKRNSLKVETRDAKRNPHREELLNGGGKIKVPCLKIEEENGQVSWLYESSDIISYMEQRYLSAA